MNPPPAVRPLNDANMQGSHFALEEHAPRIAEWILEHFD